MSKIGVIQGRISYFAVYLFEKPKPQVMAGLLTGAVSGAVSGLFDVGVGIANMISAGKIKPQFTPYSVPSAINDQLGLAQTQANAAMPGTAEYENEIASNQATTGGAISRGAKGSSSYLAAIMGNSSNTTDAYGNLLKAQAGYSQNATANLFNAEDTSAQYADKAYDINKNQPYLRSLQRKYDLQGAGISNVSSGLNAASKAVSGYEGIKDGIEEAAKKFQQGN